MTEDMITVLLVADYRWRWSAIRRSWMKRTCPSQSFLRTLMKMLSGNRSRQSSWASAVDLVSWVGWCVCVFVCMHAYVHAKAITDIGDIPQLQAYQQSFKIFCGVVVSARPKPCHIMLPGCGEVAGNLWGKDNDGLLQPITVKNNSQLRLTQWWITQALRFGNDKTSLHTLRPRNHLECISPPILWTVWLLWRWDLLER